MYEMNYFVFFRNVQRLPDLGKSIKWPKDVPRPMKKVDPMIQNIFLRWRAFKILCKYPRESWPDMNLKITAMELLKGKRAEWGIQRYSCSHTDGNKTLHTLLLMQYND